MYKYTLRNKNRIATS